jgi:VWFA-related protein
MALLWMAGAAVAALHASQAPGLRHIVSAARALAAATAHAAPPFTQPAIQLARSTVLYDPLLPAAPAPPPHKPAAPPKEWKPELAAGTPPRVKKTIVAPAAEDVRAQAPAYARLVSPLKDLGALPLPERPSLEPEPAAIIRSTTHLVQVQVVVRDRRGPIAGLTQQDFQLFDDGEEREIGAFTAAAAKDVAPPVTMILIDRYPGPAGSDIIARHSVARVLDALPAGQPVAICTLDTDFHIISDASDSPQKRAKAVRDLWPVPGYPYSDHEPAQLQVLEALADQLGKLPGRKNLLWIGSEFPNAIESENPLRREHIVRVLHSLNVANVALFPIAMEGIVAPPHYASSTNPLDAFQSALRGLPARPKDWNSGADLQEWAHETNGYAAFHMDLETALQRIFEDSHASYTLGFYPSALDGTYHSLKVKVAHRGADVLSRQGYLASIPPEMESPASRGKALNMSGITFSTAPARNRTDDPGRLFFHTEIYARSLAEKADSVIALVYRIVDKNTGVRKYMSGEAGLTEYMRRGSPVIPFATRIRNELLKPGSYRLEVTVHDTAAPDYVVRTADFEIADKHHDGGKPSVQPQQQMVLAAQAAQVPAANRPERK